ncbi:MAG: UDP-N-acetylenolpyruvoylglucosamine reductase, partial [Chitinophagaceae bacterium]|nr:UDP-N-acetylenolpyruvoylglucosamine reductase [Chitinophagaceae bacterium]
MQIQENISLKQFNTFGIDVLAKQFISFHNVDELQEALKASTNGERLILGGGSNILFTKNVNGLVLKNE